MQKNMKTLGLIAGMGELPLAIAEEASQKGYRVFAVGLEPLVDLKLADLVDDFKLINVGKLGSIINALKKASVKEAVMGGKVPKTLLYKSNIKPDIKAMTTLLKLKNKSDDSIMMALTDELIKEGITLLNTTSFTSELLTPYGILTKKVLTKDEKKDIEFGFPLAKEIGRLDVGQTVIVKGQAIMAVEAIEGTDKAIIRGGKLAGKNAVVIKVSKPNQDMRFDVPVTGLETLRSMYEVNARVLALEAQKTILVRKDKMIKKANEVGITIIGISESDLID